jgi:hypothetical protein
VHPTDLLFVRAMTCANVAFLLVPLYVAWAKPAPGTLLPVMALWLIGNITMLILLKIGVRT